MINIFDLLNKKRTQEEDFLSKQFIAPYIRGHQVRAKLGPYIYTFKITGRPREGLKVFKPIDQFTARSQGNASSEQIDRYLSMLPRTFMILVHRNAGQPWIVIPADANDDRFKDIDVVPLRLVEESAQQFDHVVARYDGATFWYHEPDMRSEPEVADYLNTSLRNIVRPDDLKHSGLVPQDRVAYAMAASLREDFEKLSTEMKIKKALAHDGATYKGHHERGDNIIIEWNLNGHRYSSTVIRILIC